MIPAGIFPGRYVQRSGALAALGDEAARLSRRAFAVCDPYVHGNLDGALALLDRIAVAYSVSGSGAP